MFASVKQIILVLIARLQRVCYNSLKWKLTSVTVDFPKLPFGELFTGKYYQKDKYGDNHPVFNMSVIGNWYIEIDNADYESMLLPVWLGLLQLNVIFMFEQLNTFNQSYSDAKVYFSNGQITEKLSSASIKLKVCTFLRDSQLIVALRDILLD